MSVILILTTAAVALPDIQISEEGGPATQISLIINAQHCFLQYPSIPEEAAIVSMFSVLLLCESCNATVGLLFYF